MNSNDRSILRGPLGASLAALCVIILFLLVMMPGLYRSTFTVFQPGASNDESVELLIAAHERNMETDVERFKLSLVFLKCLAHPQFVPAVE